MSNQRWFHRHISPEQFARWFLSHPNNASEARSQEILNMVKDRHWYRLSKGCLDSDEDMKWFTDQLVQEYPLDELELYHVFNLFKSYVTLEEGDYLWVTDPTAGTAIFTLQQSLSGTDKTKPISERLREPRPKWTLSEHDTSGNYKWSLGIDTSGSLIPHHYAINWVSTNYK